MLARVFTLIALVVLVCAPAYAQATVTNDNVHVPIDFITTSCSGEEVIISGESHVVQHSTGNGNASIAVVHINFHLAGTGASGTRYVVNEHVQGVTTSSSANTFTSEARLVAVAQGNADNLIIHTFIHTTTNANGEITSQTFEFETECQG
jgi:hypothetical protein